MDKFAILAGIASDWWWEMDADLHFTSFSERFTDVFGLPASAVVGKSRTDLNRTDYDSATWRTHLDDLANRRPFRDFETTFVDANGVSRPVMISGAPLFAPDGSFQGYIGVGHDLTELRRGQKEALEHAANLDSIIQSTDQGIVLLDRDLKIVTYNRRVIDLLEVGDGPDFQGRPYEDAVRYLAGREEYAQEDKEAAIALRMRFVRSRERVSGERTRADGRVIRVNFDPLPAGGGVMTYSDITEARRSEKRLAQSEENFRQLFAHSPLPIWVYDVATLQFLEVNDAAISKYGYSREEFLAMTLKDIRPPEDIERLTQWHRKPNEERLHAPDWRHCCKDGRILDVEIFLRDIEFNGESARFAVVVDHTARKQAERQTQRIFDTAVDLVHVTDSYGRFIQVSPSS